MKPDPCPACGWPYCVCRGTHSPPLDGDQPPHTDEAPPVVVAGFSQMFEDILDLSDYIFKKNGISPTLREVQAMARAGKLSANDLPTIWLHRFHEAMEKELLELKESLAFKWWKPTEKTDLQNTRVEIVDLFHFVVTAAVVAGMTGEDFTSVIYEKRALNFRRQVEGFKSDDNRPIGAGLLGSVPRPPDVQSPPYHAEVDPGN